MGELSLCLRAQGPRVGTHIRWDLRNGRRPKSLYRYIPPCTTQAWQLADLPLNPCLDTSIRVRRRGPDRMKNRLSPVIVIADGSTPLRSFSRSTTGQPLSADRSLAESGTTMQITDAGLGKGRVVGCDLGFQRGLVTVHICPGLHILVEPSARQKPFGTVTKVTSLKSTTQFYSMKRMLLVGHEPWKSSRLGWVIHGCRWDRQGFRL